MNKGGDEVDVIVEAIRIWWPIIFLGLSAIIEIAPIKINPWSKMFRWVGNIILSELRTDFNELSTEMMTFKREQEAKNANDMRWAIINFANSCRRGEQHSKDAWRHVLNQISEYEDYTEKHNIINGVVDAESEYLHELFQERCRRNDFIK